MHLHRPHKLRKKSNGLSLFQIATSSNDFLSSFVLEPIRLIKVMCTKIKTIDEFNKLDDETAKLLLMACCTSSNWQNQMLEKRPFTSRETMDFHAEKTWFNLSVDDRLEGFSGHPRIGNKETLRKKFTVSEAWSKNEQQGVNSASEDLLEDLTELNNLYFKKFGFVFLICATGKTAEEMLNALQERVNCTYDDEISTASEEHNKITLLRLNKLFDN